MRNQGALAAACAAVAVLGFAAPVAVADGMGNGGGPGSGTSGISGNRGHFKDDGHFNDNGDHGGDPGRGDDGGRGDDHNWNGGRGDDHDYGGRSEYSGGRVDESGRGDGSGRDDDLADGDDDFGGRSDDGPRNIVTKPGVLPAGGRLAVTVDGCRDGTMSSRAFTTTQLDRRRDDSSGGAIDIDRDARPGRYDLTVHCDGRTLIRPAAFTVLGGVQGGVGGGRSTGATPVDMAIGAGLVTLAVVGGGAFWVRRRREKRS